MGGGKKVIDGSAFPIYHIMHFHKSHCHRYFLLICYCFTLIRFSSSYSTPLLLVLLFLLQNVLNLDVVGPVRLCHIPVQQ